MMLQVCQLMHHDIVYHPMWCHDDAPVEGDVALDGATAPTGLEMLHADAVWVNSIQPLT